MKRIAPLTFAWLCLLLMAPRLAGAQQSTAIADHGMVASAEYHATEAGTRILKAGGNAYDAAAAVGFALAVTHQAAGNIGGGGFCVGLTADGRAFALDFRERAPMSAERDMYLDDEGDVVPGLSTDTHLASGVPGTVDGLLLLLQKYGTLEREQVLAPAIELAEEGYTLSASFDEKLSQYPSTREIFFPGGRRLMPGDVLRQHHLARTLKAISEKGRQGFYGGWVADAIVAEMKRGNGRITLEDLAGYRTVEREPFIFAAGEYELIGMPLPSSGGITLAQILGMVDLDELQRLGRGSAGYAQRLTEAERLAYADRNYHLGDADFVDVPVAKLVSDQYLAVRRKLMPRNRAGRSEGVTHGDGESEETTHFTVVDRWGNVAAVTYTLNGSYGSGIVVEGAGFLLNNEMDDFSAKPGVPNLYGLTGAEANAVAPGKRMLSSMTPTIVRKEGEFVFTMGTPGGSTIITTVLQVFLNVTLFGMDMAEAIEAKRIHHQWLPDEIQCEEGALSEETIAELIEMGYTLTTREIGNAAGIQRLPDGRLLGHTDTRRPGGGAAGH